MKKLSFDIDVAMEHIRQAARPFPKAAMFELRDDGFGSPFEQLIACMLSVRTRDEVSLVDARRLFNVAGNSETVAELTPEEIDALIPDVTFHGRKAAQIRDIAIRVRDDYDNILPCDAKIMQSFAGIGPKCANLALGIACGQRRLGSLDTVVQGEDVTDQQSTYRPIEDYGLIGDTHSAALISSNGSIDWCCRPSFDSPAVFCRLLDVQHGGWCRVGPVGQYDTSRSYLGDSNVLATTFRTGTGRCRVTDLMPIRQDAADHRAVDANADHRILRLIEGVSGEVELPAHLRLCPSSDNCQSL